MKEPRQSLLKLLCTIFLAVLIIVPTLSVPQRAHATLPTIDYTNLVQNIFGVIESVYQSFIAGEDWYKEWIADPLSWVAQNGVIQSMVRSVISDVVTGQDGAPSFITNIRDQLLQTGDAQVLDVVNQLRGSWAINLPNRQVFIDNAADAAFRFTGPNAFNEATQFTLGNYTTNVSACWSGDIVNAGLSCILGMSGGLTNDPIGAQGVVSARLASERAAAEATLLTEAEWGSGFISNCRENAATNSGNNEGETGSGTVSLSGDGGLGNRLNCLIETPANTLASMIDSFLPANLERVIQADEISELLGGLFASLVSDALSGDGLLGSSRPSSGGGRSFLDQGTDNSNPPGGEQLVSEFLGTVDDQVARLNTYISQWEKIQSAALSAQAECGQESAITAVLSEATQKLAIARNALTELEDLKQEAQDAEAADNPNLLAGLLAQYQAIELPNAEDIARAQSESTDTSTYPDGVTDSLYTQMVERATVCRLPFNQND